MIFSGGFRAGAMLKTTPLGAPGDSRSPTLPLAAGELVRPARRGWTG